MLRAAIRAFLLASIGAAGIALCMWFATWSPSYRECEANYRREIQSNPQGNTDQPVAFSFFDRAGTLFDCEAVFAKENGEAITGIATVLLTLVTGLLVWMAYDQGRTTRAQLRAYIQVLARGVILSDDGKKVRVFVDITNVGQTPAFNTQISWGINMFDHPLTQRLQMVTKDAPTQEKVIYPGSGHAMGKEYLHLVEAIADLNASKSPVALYVYGRATYDDIFRREQTAEFCFFLDKEALNFWLHDAQNIKAMGGDPKSATSNFKFGAFNNTASMS